MAPQAFEKARFRLDFEARTLRREDCRRAAVNRPNELPCYTPQRSEAFGRTLEREQPTPHIFALTTRTGHGSAKPLALPRVRIRLDAAQLVKNDDQDAPPAEKRDERLTAPLLR